MARAWPPHTQNANGFLPSSLGVISARSEAVFGGAPGVDTPKAEFNFMSALLDPRITYTHTNANRWGFNAAGLLVNYAATLPVFDYGPMGGGACRGINIQNTTSMPLLWNRDLTNAAWTKTDVTAAKDAVGLDGSANSCSTLTATAIGGKVTQAVTLASSLKCFYFYIKRKTGTGTVSLTMDDGVASTDITSQINSSTFTLAYMSQTLANPVVGIIFGTSGDEVIVDCGAIDISNGNIPSSPYISTTAAVSRVRDDIIVSGTNFSDWYNQSEGTFVVDFYLDYASGAATVNRRELLEIDDTTANERLSIFAANTSISNHIHAQVIDGGVTQASIDSTAFATASILQRAGLAYKLNDVQLAWNGSVSSVDTGVTIPTPTRIVIGGRVGLSDQLNGVIATVRYWNRRLTSSELAANTAI